MVETFVGTKRRERALVGSRGLPMWEGREVERRMIGQSEGPVVVRAGRADMLQAEMIPVQRGRKEFRNPVVEEIGCNHPVGDRPEVEQRHIGSGLRQKQAVVGGGRSSVSGPSWQQRRDRWEAAGAQTRSSGYLSGMYRHVREQREQGDGDGGHSLVLLQPRSVVDDGLCPISVSFSSTHRRVSRLPSSVSQPSSTHIQLPKSSAKPQ